MVLNSKTERVVLIMYGLTGFAFHSSNYFNKIVFKQSIVHIQIRKRQLLIYL